MHMEELLTKQRLKAIVWTASDLLLSQYRMLLLHTLDKFEIKSVMQISHFLAQIVHESAGFQYTEELWTLPDLNEKGVAQNGTAWQLEYENRVDLGNNVDGDGYLFKGRGLIPLLGRNEYRKFGESAKMDFLSRKGVESLLEPKWAMESAGWLWNKNNLNLLAKSNDIKGITLSLSRGAEALGNRRRYFIRAKQILDL